MDARGKTTRLEANSFQRRRAGDYAEAHCRGCMSGKNIIYRVDAGNNFPENLCQIIPATRKEAISFLGQLILLDTDHPPA
ncbi:hypothetical protein ACLB1G_06120 [Oxalobacteraceae bacterium A2-2]